MSKKLGNLILTRGLNQPVHLKVKPSPGVMDILKTLPEEVAERLQAELETEIIVSVHEMRIRSDRQVKMAFRCPRYVEIVREELLTPKEGTSDEHQRPARAPRSQ